MTPETFVKSGSIIDQKNHALFDPVADTMRQIAPLKLHLFMEFGHELSGNLQEIDFEKGIVHLKVKGLSGLHKTPSFFTVVPMHNVLALSMEIQE